MAAETPGQKASKWPWIIMGLLFAFCCCSGAAVTLPGFIRFPARSRMSECKSNLKYLFTSEKAFYAEKDRYSTALLEIGFEPERSNRYAYFAGMSGSLSRRNVVKVELGEKDDAIGVDTLRYPAMREVTLADLPFTVGVTGTCPQCEVTAGCVGNVDEDPTLDVWSISTADRSIDGNPVPPGTPYHHVDDNDR